jgi:hypothetical protein
MVLLPGLSTAVHLDSAAAPGSPASGSPHVALNHGWGAHGRRNISGPLQRSDARDLPLRPAQHVPQFSIDPPALTSRALQTRGPYP